MNGLTDIPGIRVGHASDFDALTGCTVILCEEGATGGVDIRGYATGTSEIDTLRPGHVAEKAHAIVLSGGSAFGLEAASGVRSYLASRGIGFDTGVAKVPIVPSAILFDLGIGKAGVRPGREMGQAAAAHALSGPVPEGCVGAGTGATVGKLFGMRRAMKSGIGCFSVSLPGSVVVSALVATNALGDVRDPASGRIVAGARVSPESREFIDSEKQMLSGKLAMFGGGHTTLGVVATNAHLSKLEAGKLAALASLGVARSISPVNTSVDGDVMFALSCGTMSASIDVLGTAAAHAVAQAVLRSVQQATSMGGVPGLLNASVR